MKMKMFFTMLLAALCAYAVYDLVVVKLIDAAPVSAMVDAVTMPTQPVQAAPAAAPVMIVYPTVVPAMAAPAMGVYPTAVSLPPVMMIVEPTQIPPAPSNVYAPAYVEVVSYQPDYSDYTHETNSSYSPEYVEEYYADKTFTTDDGAVMSLEDAEFLLACVDGKAAGRRVSPKCPSNAAELLGSGR